MKQGRTSPHRRCRAAASRRSVKMGCMSIDDTEREARRGVVDQARASSTLEGQCSGDVARADQEAWVRGEIDIDELLERVRRYE